MTCQVGRPCMKSCETTVSWSSPSRWTGPTTPTHPSLIDEEHHLGELYNMVNVPTVVWVDEEGRIARPNDVAFTTEKGGRFAAVSTHEQMDLLRGWVREELPPKPASVLHGQVAPMSTDSQLARAHFGLGWWLHQAGTEDAAERHFRIGGDLALCLGLLSLSPGKTCRVGNKATINRRVVWDEWTMALAIPGFARYNARLTKTSGMAKGHA